MILLLPGNSGAFKKKFNPTNFGFLLTPRRTMVRRMRTLAHVSKWAIDNECYSLGANFRFERYSNFVSRAAKEYSGQCLFVTVPDVVADAAATMELWNRFAPLLHAYNLPLAFVAQDGLTELPPVTFDALFIGGSTAYKLSPTVADLIAEAKQRGKWVHVGRVNTPKRILHFWKLGADSLDGTAWAKRPDFHLAWVISTLGWLHQQLPMKGVL